jgi:hypothetical protein
MIKQILILIISFLSLSTVVNAGTCWNGGSTGSSPYDVLNGSGGSASLAIADVRYCLETVANDGDIVVLPEGTASWSTGTNDILIPSGVKLQGSGTLGTIITPAPTSYYAILRTSGNNEISNIYFKWALGGTTGKEAIWLYGTGNKIHDNKFENSVTGQGVYGVYTYGGSGVIYDNVFLGTSIFVTNKKNAYTDWATDTSFGNNESGGVVYVEDNTFTASPTEDSIGRCIDSEYGGRYVFRYNKVEGFYLLAHGITTPTGGLSILRSTRTWELYGNVTTSGKDWGINNWVPPLWLRGGSGYAWGNTFKDWDYNQAILPILDIPRVTSTAFLTTNNTSLYGRCDGDNDYDGNTGGTGYPCRDQIGRDKDTSLLTIGTPPYASQDLHPAYFWNNNNEHAANVNMRLHPAAVDALTPYIQANRDYYDYNASFDGSTGVGSGVYASRPATCTAGVAYWVTDQGEWASGTDVNGVDHTGADGWLSKCPATNTWSAITDPESYMPYDYPHPLRGPNVKINLTGPGLSTTETAVRAGTVGVISIVISGDTFVESDDALKLTILAGLNGSTAFNTCIATQLAGSLVRSSTTQYDFTPAACASYNITSVDSVTWTIPATAITSGNAAVAGQGITINSDSETGIGGRGARNAAATMGSGGATFKIGGQ